MNNVDYNANILDHFKNPRNMGELKNADAEATVGNPSCGDVMKIMIKVSNNKIENIKFQTMGCAAAIATSSMATELAKRKTLDEAEKITNKDVSLALGKLPPIKEHCSNLAADALKKAIANYKKNYNESPKLPNKGDSLNMI
ncbi:iron-sulfur cluster assembly scaffold protein [archaeon]|nr:iron-sulfur cluster assembly scaffold protein [archaeon]